ncbi:laminin subunit beta-1b isoform X3 [Salminus brasiliensis]|uniref:laminin subunit beta-1b isoform X3 n=1 Tax=Salminus brasiliensis TaxID=930266 RepID=UPI003B836004
MLAADRSLTSVAGAWPLLSVEPARGLVDERFQIVVRNLNPGQGVTLHCVHQSEDRDFWEAFGHYVSDELGTVTVAKDASVGGTYKGVECMGLMWSLQPVPGSRTGLRLRKKDVLLPMVFHISVYDGHVTQGFNLLTALGTCVIERWYMAPGVQRLSVREKEVRGTLFIPPGPGPFPAVLDMWGGGGGLVEYRAALLASHGFVSLALEYLSPEDTYATELNAGYFETAFEILQDHPMVQRDRVALFGLSFGSSVSLSMAAYSKIVKPRCCVCISGSHLTPVQGSLVEVFEEISKKMWKVQMKDNQLIWREIILPIPTDPKLKVDVGQIKCPLLLVNGDDDQNWPTAESAKDMEQIMEKAGNRHLLQILSYPGAGHLIEPPYTPHHRASNFMVQSKEKALGLGVLAQYIPDHNDKCAEGSCYPATGDLLIGRAHRLIASSTCGLDGPETYCIVSSLQAGKCLECDSRERYNEYTYPNSHTIDNVVTTFTPNRLKTWWQSQYGVENVTIQLDLEAEFHFTHLIMTFKTFRPAAMIIERSADYGQSWNVYRYFAFDCSVSFPQISQGPVINVDDVICDSRYSNMEPSSEGEVIFRALDPVFKIPDPYSQKIQNLLRITNLRVQMLKLHTLGDDLLDGREEVKRKYYYALYDMVVRGNCFCYGHASECAPVIENEEADEGMVHGHCMCKHHTTGLNCEVCEEFYQDAPWRPAEGRNTNACKKCECNYHSNECHFDMAVYLSSGNVSGGVCDNCQHNTQGQHCDDCKPFYYQHANRHLRDPHICEPCDCDPHGSLNDGVCDSVTDVPRGLIAGQCRCKPNVEGERCDHCKQGHYGLSNNPLGCLPCSCNPLGTLPGGNPCDTETGRCFCKRLVTGQYCDQCRPQFWGLSNDMDGCRPCDCDLGGAMNNDCSPVTGQCVCREHMFGRRCDQVESGYYFAALDHYIYEAEDAAFQPGVKVVPRPLPVDRHPTWTGSGFANVPEGETLTFTIDNVPQSMEYNLLIRYEPQLPDVWEQVMVNVQRTGFPSSSAHCSPPYADQQSASLPPGYRYVVLPRPVCLETGQTYTVEMLLALYSSQDHHQYPHMLIDSIVLVPVVRDLELFSGSSDRQAAWEMFQKYRCLEQGQSVQKTPMSDICREYIFSASALLHQGAMECHCDPRGSLSLTCDSIGGQCPCRLNVVGKKCDTCSPGTFQLGPSGCRPCECDPLGSRNAFCHTTTGQCSCLPGVYGRQCAHCLHNHWGFPHCQECFCNGHSQHCHPQTGQCLECRDHTAGHHCERCESGYHGNALLGSGEQCRPCMCPDGPGSGRQFADTCYQNPNSRQLVCVCSPGYKGPRCDECTPGYYGNPQVVGGRCHPCQCNGNIDMHDPGACDSHTGVCLRCLFHTEGHRCQHCSRGYHGDANTQSCQKCMCLPLGTAPQSCNDGECDCDRVSGQCACLPRVEGLHCDRCAPNTWNINSREGCQPCRCHPKHSYGLSCDLLSGQCSCKPGFGGRTCEECRELFWGDPEVRCYACDCDPRGIATPQCNKMTGKCVCVEGVAGQRCDSCGRGYVGTFPDCQQCHQCFSDWDVTVGELTNQTQRLVDNVEELKVSGVVTAYQDTVSSLESGVKQLTQIIEDNKAQQTLTYSENLLQQARELKLVLGRSLNRSAVTVGQVSADHTRAVDDLNTLSQEAQELQDSTEDKQAQVLRIKHSNLHGAADSIRDYYQQSLDAEGRANRATTDPLSPVKKSADLRQVTETTLNAIQEEFELKQRLQGERLDKLNKELGQDDLSKISHQVCGGASGPDGCGDCGGLGCVSDDGVPHCGGENCKGLLTQSREVENKAKDLDRDILNALKEVEKLHRMVSDARGRADEAKLSAQDVLLKTNQSKARVEQTNQELRELIQEIRDFLTNGADLERIETLSDEVLNLKMPMAAGELKNITMEIRQHVASLTNVDVILAESAEQAHIAESLLHEARTISGKAVQLKEEAEEVKAALNEAENAQTAANKSLELANSDLDFTKQQMTSVESETAASEFKLSNSTQRLLDLDSEVRAVREKTLETFNSADVTQRKTDYISEDTQQTKRMLELEVEPQFQLVSGLMGQKAVGVSNAIERVEQLRQEAKILLDDATNKLQRLGELEREFSENQQTLAERAEDLEGLEKAAEEVLQELSQRVTVYSTCL